MAFEIRSFDLRDVRGLSQAALNLHVDLYHGYVEQVNALLEVLQPQAPAPHESAALTREAAARRFPFEYNGMVLHELFFEQLAGTKGRPPHERGPLGRAVGNAFGGFDGWREDFEKLAATRGVGWVITMSEAGGTLFNTWIDEHHWGTTVGTDVIFVLDVWEHAYLLDFSPKQRSEYIQAVFDNVDWSIIESRLR